MKLKQLKNNMFKITTNKKKYYIRRSPIGFKDLISTTLLPGFDVTISGRLRGAARAKQINVSKGVIKVNSLSHHMQAKNFPVQTKWGKLGIKLCLN